MSSYRSDRARPQAAAAGIAAAALVALAACAAGPAVVSDWVQGTWTCSSDNGGTGLASTVEVGDGTWSFAHREGDLGSVDGTVDGTWELSGGRLSVRTTSGGGFAGYTSFRATGLPAEDAALEDAGKAQALWTPSDADPAQPLSLDAREDRVSVLHTDPLSGASTTTECTKS